jgi:hypothetical protein
MAFLASHHIHLKYSSSFYDITQMDWYNNKWVYDIAYGDKGSIWQDLEEYRILLVQGPVPPYQERIERLPVKYVDLVTEEFLGEGIVVGSRQVAGIWEYDILISTCEVIRTSANSQIVLIAALAHPFKCGDDGPSPTPKPTATPEPDLESYFARIRLAPFGTAETPTGAQYVFSQVTAVYRIEKGTDDQRITVGLISEPDASKPLWYFNASSESGIGDVACLKGDRAWYLDTEEFDDETQISGCLGSSNSLEFNTSYRVEIVPFISTGNDGWDIFINGIHIAQLSTDRVDHRQDHFMRDFKTTNAFSCSELSERPPALPCRPEEPTPTPEPTEEPTPEPSPEPTATPEPTEEPPDGTDGVTGSDVVEP